MNTIELSTLITLLQNQLQAGGLTVEYFGTLLIKETGNQIILTTEKQY